MHIAHTRTHEEGGKQERETDRRGKDRQTNTDKERNREEAGGRSPRKEGHRRGREAHHAPCLSLSLYRPTPQDAPPCTPMNSISRSSYWYSYEFHSTVLHIYIHMDSSPRSKVTYRNLLPCLPSIPCVVVVETHTHTHTHSCRLSLSTRASAALIRAVSLTTHRSPSVWLQPPFFSVCVA